MTEMDPVDTVWREWTARRVLTGDVSRTARELIHDAWPHTAAELWTADENTGYPMNPGWLYYDSNALLFIGDHPIRFGADGSYSNDDRLAHFPYTQLGNAEILKAHNRQERLVRFADGNVFLMPKRYARRIAALANR